MEALDKIRDTSYSHKRTFVVEVMGRNAGDIALWAGIASGADQIIIPEEGYDINEVVAKVKDGYENKGKERHLIVLAEGVMHAEKFAELMKEAGDTSDLVQQTLVTSFVVVHHHLVIVCSCFLMVLTLLNCFNKVVVDLPLVSTTKN